MKDYNKNIFKDGDLIPLDLGKVDRIILHHSESITGKLADIHKWHLERGWKGYGYNFGITQEGKRDIGRGLYIGAQCNGQNAKSIGICAYGDFTKQDIKIEQLLALRQLINDLENYFDRILKKYNHKELDDTECPAIDLKNYDKLIYDYIDKILNNLKNNGILSDVTLWKNKLMQDENLIYLLNNINKKLGGI